MLLFCKMSLFNFISVDTWSPKMSMYFLWWVTINFNHRNGRGRNNIKRRVNGCACKNRGKLTSWFSKKFKYYIRWYHRMIPCGRNKSVSETLGIVKQSKLYLFYNYSDLKPHLNFFIDPQLWFLIVGKLLTFSINFFYKYKFSILFKYSKTEKPLCLFSQKQYILNLKNVILSLDYRTSV